MLVKEKKNITLKAIHFLVYSEFKNQISIDLD
jgi:hypothetical protein